MVYDLSYNVVGFIFLLILTLYFLIIPIFPNRSNKWFKIILIFSTISLGLDILTGYTINNASSISLKLNYFLNILFFCFYWSIAFIFNRYALIITKQESKYKKLSNIIFISYFILMQIIIISSPIFHTVFYFDNQNIYKHGFLYIPLALINISLVLSAGFYVIIKRKKIKKIQAIIIPSYTLLIISANILQVFYPTLFINGSALALATFIMFLTLQNPNSYFDQLTKTFNRESLQEYLYKLILKDTPFQVIVIDIEKTNIINKSFGEEIGSNVISSVAKKILDGSKKKNVFRIEGDTFLIITKSEKEQTKIIERLQIVFPFIYSYKNFKFSVKTHINYSKTLYGFENTNEAIAIIKECSIQTKKSSSRIFNLTSIERIKRVRKIERVLNKAIKNKSICVYLQPIVSSKTNIIEKAEALTRIKDDELGLIMPSEFIHIAERDGSISEIAPIVIEKLCEYLNSVKLPSTFKQISVNLSVINCLDPFFANNVLEILNKHNINPNFFIFEVTETMASVAPQLKETMKILQKEGITFAMDDFGTGYANLDSVLHLPFNTIKIDRQLLILSNDIRYKVLLKGILKILNQLNLESIIEGVETKNQANLIKDIGGTYQQGFFYAKPMNLKDFYNFLYNY